MEKELKAEGRKQKKMQPEDIPDFVERLDGDWGLEGLFQKKMPTMPTDYSKLQKEGEDRVTFDDFWQWFEAYIAEHDVVREELFRQAEERRAEAESKAAQLKEERERREHTIAEVHELRRSLE